MAKYPNDDLFESTKMSFGEHLEELRICLFRAMLGLMIGFGIGLYFGTYVVDFIQLPLRRAMITFHMKRAIADLEKKHGQPVAPGVRRFIQDYQVVPEEMYFDFDELKRLVAASEASDADTAAATVSPAETLVAVKAPVKQIPQEKSPAVGAADGPGGKAEEPATKLQFVHGDPPVPRPVMIKSRFFHPLNLQVTSLRADEAFMIWMKAGFVFGTIFASPWIFYQVWLFVAAGLYPHEKKYVHIYLPTSLFLFLAGASLAFFFVFDPVLEFLFGFNEKMNIGIDARISEWLSFVLILPLGFGISFQLPLVMLFLNRLGVVPVEAYVEKWRIAILAVFVISMVLTPADPISMLLMAVPLSFLYFCGVAMCKWMPKGQSPFVEPA